jgi:hypothetical protein
LISSGSVCDRLVLSLSRKYSLLAKTEHGCVARRGSETSVVKLAPSLVKRGGLSASVIAELAETQDPIRNVAMLNPLL